MYLLYICFRIQQKLIDFVHENYSEHTCEVLALWKILCEHQFHLLFMALPPKEQEDLAAYTFRDLILSRGEICALLIASLINSYLSDNATVGSISSKLRDVCPNLYRHENAVLHKVSISSRNGFHFQNHRIAKLMYLLIGYGNSAFIQKLYGPRRAPR